MLEPKLFQKYLPTPQNLSVLYPVFPSYYRTNKTSKKKWKSWLDDIKKTWRIYIEFISFYDETDFVFTNNPEKIIDAEKVNNKLTDDFNQKFFDPSYWSNEIGKKMSNKTIKKWLEYFVITPQEWIDKFDKDNKLSKQQKEEILNLVPFDCFQKVSEEEIKSKQTIVFTNELSTQEQKKILKALLFTSELRKKIENKIEQKEKKLDDLTSVEEEEILNKISSSDWFKKFVKRKLESNKKKTIQNDFITLVKYKIINKIPKTKGKYYKLDAKKITSKLNSLFGESNIFHNTNLEDELYETLLDNTIATSLNTFRQNNRFFIKFQHIINDRKHEDNVDDIINELRLFWEEQKDKLVWIKYQSASKNDSNIADYIIYPINLFYNQRGFYLTGYGQSPSNRYDCTYYNYRLDHLSCHENKKYLISIEWADDVDKYYEKKDKNDSQGNIPDILIDLIEQKAEIEQWKANHVFEQFCQALGVDLDKDIKTMLLRFPEPFHHKYILESNRHDTFEQLEFADENDLIKQLKARVKKCNQKRLKIQTNNCNKIAYNQLKESDIELIKKTIEKYPADSSTNPDLEGASAYYTMNYRHGDESTEEGKPAKNVEADVIMRLRAWCPNVEVLFPADLRQRMRREMQQTWEFYQNDSQ